MKEVIEMKEKNILADAVRLFDKYIKNTGISWDGGKNFAQVTGIERGTGFSIEDFSKEQIKIYAKGKIYAENLDIDYKIPLLLRVQELQKSKEEKGKKIATPIVILWLLGFVITEIFGVIYIYKLLIGLFK